MPANSKATPRAKSRVSSKMTSIKHDERRRHKRRVILDTFHVYLSIPKVGPQKFYLRDIGEGGMAILTESLTGFRKGATLDCLFFINPGLFLKLRIRAVHTMKLDANQFLIDRKSVV